MFDSKKEFSVKISEFRPISLVSSLYKILRKVLSKRLRATLGDTVSSVQGAFVNGRQILDVFLVANKAVEKYRVLKKVGLFLKLILRKPMIMCIGFFGFCNV